MTFLQLTMQPATGLLGGEKGEKQVSEDQQARGEGQWPLSWPTHKIWTCKSSLNPSGFLNAFLHFVVPKKFHCKKGKLNNTIDSLYSGHYMDLKLVSSLVRVHNNGNLFQSNIYNYFCLGFSCRPYYRGVHYSEVSARRELTVILIKIINFRTKSSRETK